MKTHQRLLVAGLALTLLPKPFTALAQSTWVGSTTQYQVSNNWSPVGVPTSATTIETANGSATNTINLSGNRTVAQFNHNRTVTRLNGSGTISTGKGGTTNTSHGILIVDGSTSSSFSGTIANGPGTGSTVSLAKRGTSTLTLSGTNTYTGTTTVSGGALLVDGSTAFGSAITASAGVLGGAGIINGAVTINAGAGLLGGNGTIGTALTINDALTLDASSVIYLTIGPGGTKSVLTRTGGAAWVFDSNQAFSFIDAGADTGVYSGVITGLDTDPGTLDSWTIRNSGWAGTFNYNSGSVDLVITAVPEPSTLILLIAGGAVTWLVRRRRR
jgi:autotransporter-associated beta strand protein